MKLSRLLRTRGRREMKQKERKASLVGIIVLVIGAFVCSSWAQIENEPRNSSWEGTYIWGDDSAGNGVGNGEGLSYVIRIYRAGGALIADVDEDGLAGTVSYRYRCDVRINNNKVEMRLRRYLKGGNSLDSTPHQIGSLLLTFVRDATQAQPELLTYWGKIRPLSADPTVGRYKTGNVFFRKVEPKHPEIFLAISGYLDLIDVTPSGCRIRFISGDMAYVGIVTFERLSALIGRRIRNYEETVAFFEGKQVNVSLSGVTITNNCVPNCSFGGISKLTIVAANGSTPAKPQWKETTTAEETIIDLSADILFDFNKASINPNAVPTLIKLARLLRQTKGNAVQLNGFTDSIGTDEYNIGLSRRRSDAVKQWLVSKGGIEAARLTTNGFGKAQPVAPNTNSDGSDNPAGRQKNRRVEIRIPKN